MTILNIIDRRKRPYRFKKVNAIIEPTRHDNRCKDCDRADGQDDWIGYAESEHVSLHEAIEWASMHHDDVTLYLYDEDGGIYADEASPVPSKD